MPQFLTTDEIRRRWIEFFKSHGHKHIASDSLVPQNDPSVLFTGAGMNQFKDHFLGRARIEHPQQRAVTVQKCIRTGDIENVGRTPNHHTFFEMLGNFSFGDYFKKEAIDWAWQFCTDPVRGLGLEKERLSVTIFGGDPKLGIEKDTEAEKWWHQYAPELKNADGSWRIYDYGEHDNFWPADAPSLGPNGPCGPCSEIYYDTKPEQGAPERVAESKDSTRYVEIWNLVFTQFNRVDKGKLEPLSQKNIDTGAGLERMVRVIQKIPNNYESDLLFPIVQEVAKLANTTYGKDKENDRRMRRITDHTRSAVFCIADGVAPDKAGRNYVVRRLIRRAILDGRELGTPEVCIESIGKKVISQMKQGYSELADRGSLIVKILNDEERAFNKTAGLGEVELKKSLMVALWCHLKKHQKSSLHKVFPLASALMQTPNLQCGFDQITGEAFHTFLGEINEEVDSFKKRLRALSEEWWNNIKLVVNANEKIPYSGRGAFRMWDTFGFPIELTVENAESYGFVVDVNEYQIAFNEAVKRSQAGSSMAKEIFASGPVAEIKKKFAGKPTRFDGYTSLETKDVEVLAIVQGENIVDEAKVGEAVLLLDRTPFYAESGGQVSDRGRLISPEDGESHEVLKAQKQEGLFFHYVRLGGNIEVGDRLQAVVDPQHRLPTLKHHSATHLLHNVLRATLGTHVEQRGSLVAPDRLRFDFTHFEQIKPEQLVEIEQKVNELVLADFPVKTEELPIAEAKTRGAMALFGEKYGDRVRVVTMGPSVELCGGTHCASTGQIGYFRIVSESSIQAGVRRIEALTGLAAVADARRSEEMLNNLALMLKTKKETVHERFLALQDEKTALDRELESARKKAANATAGELLGNVKEIKGVKVLTAQIEGADVATLRTTLDGLRKSLKEAAIVLGGIKDGKVALLVSFSPEIVQRGAHAGNLLKELAPKVGGKGGGKPDMAQGGGSDGSKLAEALASVESLLAGMLK